MQIVAVDNFVCNYSFIADYDYFEEIEDGGGWLT